MRKILCLLAIIAAWAAGFAAEVAVTASFESEIVQQLPMKLQIQITYKGNVEIRDIGLDLPEDIVRAGFTSSSFKQQYINGQTIAVRQQLIGLKAYTPGNYTIPPIQVKYFDYDSGQSGVAYSDSLVFEVKASTAKGFTPGAEGAPKWLSGILLLVIFGGVFWHVQRQKKQAAKIRQSPAETSVRSQYRAQLLRISEDDPQFWEKVAQWIRTAMQEKFGEAAENQTLLEMLNLLQNELSIQDYESVKPIFEMCHQARFAPIETDNEQRSQTKTQLIEHFLKIFP